MTRIFFLLITTFLLATHLAAASPRGKLVHVIRFSDYKEGSIEDWLKGKGFVFELDAKYRNRLDLDVDERGLIVDAKQKLLAIMGNESVNVPEFSTVEIDWGMIKYPVGNSYEKGIRNEALMVVIFLGDERKPSGSWFIPDSPYFIGLFLCNEGRINHLYVGKYFKKSGRYVCLSRPPAPGRQVTTSFNLLSAYRNSFDKEGDDDPAISGIALAVDTKKARDGGRSSAFIKEIRFYK